MQLTKSKTFVVVILIVIVFIFTFYSINNSSDEVVDNIKYKDIKVKSGNFKVTVSANGVVQPIDRIEIKSKASGEIIRLPVNEGDFIKKDDLIAQLDQKDERTDLEQTKADLDIA